MKKAISTLLAAMLTLGLLAGCANTQSSSVAPPADSVSEPAPAAEQPEEPEDEPEEPQQAAEGTTIRIAGLKGPTTMGIVKLMADAAAGETANDYQVEMYGTADEIVPQLISGGLDAAMVPANLASTLYNRTEGGIQVFAINTLGVLYVVETGEQVNSVEDLRGKTIYSTGKGTTPEFVLNYILTQNGIDPENDVTIEYRSESTEIAAVLAAGEDAIAVLPQPYVTAVGAQNENVRVALDLTEEWNKVSTGSSLVTGVLVARSEFVEQNPNAFAQFYLADYKASIDWVNANVEEAAELVVEYGIMENAAMAAKAIPACNIFYTSGEELYEMLGGYLQVLYEADPAAVGGALPGDDFYYDYYNYILNEG